ncbi:MAG: GH3 auxin-responsive promoter family protein [Vicinamibacterales bacterium]
MAGAHHLLLAGAMAVNGVRYWRPLAAQLRDPAAAQAAALQRILGANASTAFGRQHGFASASTPDAYRARTPIQDYETLRPWVESQRTTGAQALTVEAPLFYAQTSGSTGAPKYIPVTPTALKGYKSEQALFTYLQYRACPEAFRGRAWGIMGAASEGHLDSGHIVGSVSGHLYSALPSALQARFVIPPEVSSIHDYETKYLVILRLALGVDDVTYLGSPNPSTFVRLLAMLNERRDLLARSLEAGTLPDGVEVSGEVSTAIAPRLRRRPEMARALRSDKPLTYASLWPGIRLITTWTGGSCGIALETLRRTLPAGCTVMELGYQATEFRGTLALEAEVAGGVPPLHHHFFEFVEQAEWEAGGRTCIGLERLVAGGRYYVLVTTAAGLYRYTMNDIVEVTGFFERSPLLRFVQKGKGITSVTGEKLYESQAIEAVQKATGAYAVTTSFFLLVADETSPAYHLYVELDGGHVESAVLARAVDAHLGGLNLEYQSKRGSGRLGAVRATRLKPGAGDAFKRAAVAAGQREGQFKPAVLHYRRELKWPVEQHVDE